MVLILMTLLFGCNPNVDKSAEVRIVDIELNENQKQALNFLAVNFDPWIEKAYHTNDGAIECKVYLYFNISKEKKEIILKREDYIVNRSDNGQLIPYNKRVERFYFYPLNLIEPANVTVKQNEDIIISMRHNQLPYHVEVTTLYNQPIKTLSKWYSVGKDHKFLSEYVSTSNGFYIDARFDSEKAEAIAYAFKVLSTIK
jgi:hypothetical protein